VRDAESGTIAAPIWGRIMMRFGEPGPDWKASRRAMAMARR
jgi:hypothetical protein